MDKVSVPKVLAVFLPQFYRTAENDAWWGEEFTDWTSVKKAKKLFFGDSTHMLNITLK